MKKEEKLQVYQDVKKEIESLSEGVHISFCFYGDPFSNGFIVERCKDDKLGKLFFVNGYLMRRIPEIIAMTFKHIMS